MCTGGIGVGWGACLAVELVLLTLLPLLPTHCQSHSGSEFEKKERFDAGFVGRVLGVSVWVGVLVSLLSLCF